MFIFAGDFIKSAIPENRIFRLQLVGKEIVIEYDGGEIITEDSGIFPKVETIILKYENEEKATEKMRGFYVACLEKKGAYSF